MTLPFTTTEFFSVFAAYNAAVWPAQVVLWLLALGAAGLIATRRAGDGRLVAGLLALLWTWMALAYHAAFFSEINPAAWLFAALFVGAALVFAWLGVVRRQFVFDVRGVQAAAGWLLVAAGLVAYPLASGLAGHRYPAMPTFGLPCPTTLYTLGVLLLARGCAVRRAMVVPLAWAAIGTTAAFQLGVREDLMLGAAGVIALAALAAQRRRHPPAAPQ